MRFPIPAIGALALASMTLALTSGAADARGRHKGTSGAISKGVSARGGLNNTGGGRASPSAAGGNANQPSRPGAQGSGGGGGNSGQ